MGEVGEIDGLGAAAFLLCELEWMRKLVIERLACTDLADFIDEIGTGVGEIDGGHVERVRATTEDAEELVAMVGHRLSMLPHGAVRASADEVAAAAAAALVDGIADVERALHAARWIEVRAGLRTLSAMLTASDAYRFWEVPVERFVAAFRGADQQLAASIAIEAEVSDLLFSELNDLQIARLAAVLRWAHGTGR